MKVDVDEGLAWLESQIETIDPVEKIGYVTQITGLVIESNGPEVSLGDIVKIASKKSKALFDAEVVGFRDNRVLLMPLSEVESISPGCQVFASKRAAKLPVGEGLIGRVIDGLGRPIDDIGVLRADYVEDLKQMAPNPMKRKRIEQTFQTGVKAIDAFSPMGMGQRLGIFAGSGVGKSSLLGMIARGAQSDINVIALVGERGRELREFIEVDLGEEGLKKSIIIVSTSDQPAPLRMRAAWLAMRIAEQFRSDGKNVLFMMDSLTRFAMAQREIGLTVGEPPTSRGYTPSTFAKLAHLVERSGMGERGSITAFFTVLVEGDDMNEPVADAVRGLLDGHIILSRSLATGNHYPAVDVLESVSRLVTQVCSKDEMNLIGQARDLLSTYRKNEDLISVGAYIPGTSSKIDRSIELYESIMKFLKQPIDKLVSRSESFKTLSNIIG